MKRYTAHFTGHREKYLYGLENNVNKGIQILTEYALKKGYRRFISGMALGVDLWAAEYILNLINEGEDLYLICAIPFEEHHERWSDKNKEIFKKIIKQVENIKGSEIKIINSGGYSVRKLFIRNEWMADNASLCLGCYIPTISNGGTYKQLKYSKKKGLETIFIDPRYEISETKIQRISNRVVNGEFVKDD